MAKPKKKQPLPASRPPILKAVLLVLACSVAGGAIVYKYGGTIRHVAQSAREQGLGQKLERAVRGTPAAPTPHATPVTPAAPAKLAEIKPALPGLAAPAAEPEPTPAEEGQPAKMSRPQLEREVERLREVLAARDRENSEMKIQLKLLRDGSRSRR
jgi:hypothetical protein